MERSLLSDCVGSAVSVGLESLQEISEVPDHVVVLGSQDSESEMERVSPRLETDGVEAFVAETERSAVPE
jgi:hypothetical protein